MDHNIKTLVVELTNKCDLNCEFCSRNNNTKELDFGVFKTLIEENSNLQKPITHINLEGAGNAFEHERIEDILITLKNNNMQTMIMTNGLNLKRRLAFYDDELLKNIHFGIYFDSPDENENDEIMGKKAYKKTLESFGYLSDRNLKYDIMMRIFPKNYDKIGDMMNICRHCRSNCLVPMEVFPIGKANADDYIMDDTMKKTAIDDIHELGKRKLPIHLNGIQFSQITGNCSYARGERLFLTSKGCLSFCHFLSAIDKTKLKKYEKGCLEDIISKNDRLRSDFGVKKSKNLESLKFMRKTASACSYCLAYYTKDYRW